MIRLRGRAIYHGKAQGVALVSPIAIGFLGGVDPQTGIVVEPGHPLHGQFISGRVLVFPTGKGSTVGSYTLYRLARNGLAPAAIINARSEAVVAIGAILAEIPMVDRIDIAQIKTGDTVRIDGEDVLLFGHSERSEESHEAVRGESDPRREEMLHSVQHDTSLPSPSRHSERSEESPELVFVKLGGSLITDKSREATARPGVIDRLAREIRRVLDACPDLRLVLGHGSGSFGHVVAQRYQVQSGCTDWRGYAETGAVAARLNRIVTDAMLTAGVPVVSLQPSASARARAGELIELAVHPVQDLLRRGLVPLVYGDVALDDEWGSTIISTEVTFVYLARRLHPQRILLVGEVEGVYTADPRQDAQARLIPVLRASRMDEAESVLGGSHAVDVTGGMRSKVQLMMGLLCDLPDLRVSLLSGLQPGLLERALCDPAWNPGTLIMA